MLNYLKENVGIFIALTIVWGLFTEYRLYNTYEDSTKAVKVATTTSDTLNLLKDDYIQAMNVIGNELKNHEYWLNYSLALEGEIIKECNINDTLINNTVKDLVSEFYANRKEQLEAQANQNNQDNK